MSGFTFYESPVDGAGTHAIVIGVGRYPHLHGGDGAPTEHHEGMGQLTSPPVSARKVAAWLRKLRHPDKPVASISLLHAEKNPKPFSAARGSTRGPGRGDDDHEPAGRAHRVAPQG